MAHLDAFEWSCWKVLLESDPFGDDRADWRAAQITSAIINFAGKASTREVGAEDLLLRFQQKTEKIDVETKIRNGFARIMAAQNAGRTQVN